ncbi:Nif3-like dinuclear metal center hexameric protein [Gemelliphila asaccharolytica]|uniref:GTP cyclohydrolase 1 type 2 homolog n=1 Tax=Gemelliphila asaccharolytica TaxID=502393 RepID=A0ABR5TND5_9BACL|nr:Nif3-like dinuclear metal center hexameric protein [Gemella asaccharolytica]KXB58945.1 dinuclear metal center protein, YbgI family [Gemella asaccharolytica]
MIIVKDIYNYIKNLADERLSEDWDNVGFMLGDDKRQVSSILVCLDVTDEVVKEAINKKVDLIISHHPLIFKPIKSLNYNDFKARIISKLIKNDIAVISAHTNLDSAKFGLNYYLSKELELENIEVLFENNDFKGCGLGRKGTLKEKMKISEFSSFVKRKLNLKYVKLITKNPDNYIKKVALLGGSGGDFIYKLPDVDIYLTGDVSYHQALDSIEMNKNVIDIGHFSENICKKIFKEYLENINSLKNINIYLSEVEENPFQLL